MKVRVFDIQWDTDGDKELLATLPAEMYIEVEEADDDEISDAISNEIGFCHFGFDYEILGNKTNWFQKIADNLRDYSEGEVWSSGDEILCRTKEGIDAIADLFFQLYSNQNNNVNINTGYYDIDEDTQNGELDRFSGWYYINID